MNTSSIDNIDNMNNMNNMYNMDNIDDIENIEFEMQNDSSLSSPITPTSPTSPSSPTSQKPFHQLFDKWTLWAHLPHDTDWSMKSYIQIFTFQSIEEAIALANILPEKMIKNCMLFIMRNGIHPLWEDPKNREGGCFSLKISNKNVCEVWKQIMYSTVGETISKSKKLYINGCTISPKKNFCIIKIWTSNCDEQNSEKLNIPESEQQSSCLFKKHVVQY